MASALLNKVMLSWDMVFSQHVGLLAFDFVFLIVLLTMPLDLGKQILQ